MKLHLSAALTAALGLSTPALAQSQAPPATAPATAPARPAAAGAVPTPVAAPVELAFPGQWSAPVPDRLKPSNPKPCKALNEVAERAACFEHTSFNWPGLQRYEAANKALAPAKPRETRVIFVGDSITDNWSKPGYGGFFPGKPYVNRGIGGQTSGQMLVRFRSDVLSHKPRVVVILTGTNDVAGNVGPLVPGTIENNIMSMAELARANGVKVVLASLLPVSDDKRDEGGRPRLRTGDRPPATLKALNAWIADYARKNRHTFLDYHAAVADPEGALRPELNDDGLHPNAAGYAAMAPLAEKAIAAALRSR